MASTAEDIRKHVRLYWIVFFALAILTVVTVSASHLEVTIGVAVVIALIIAIVKGSLVASVFMHLFFDRNRAIAALLVLCLFLFIVLMFIPVLTVSDSIGEPYVP